MSVQVYLRCKRTFQIVQFEWKDQESCQHEWAGMARLSHIASVLVQYNECKPSLNITRAKQVNERGLLEQWSLDRRIQHWII